MYRFSEQRENINTKIFNVKHSINIVVFPLSDIYIGKGKCKAIPLQAWTGPEGSSRLRLPDFKTIGT